jgi:4-amino-4-deoxy-L-arabinose transferase-like glycosyltransferase
VSSARRTWLALAALTTAGAALRLPFLGLQSLWYDEAFTLSVVDQPSLGEAWDRVRETESTPPLYYLLTWGWAQLVGDSGDTALRAPGAIAGVLCVPAVFAAVRRLGGERPALAAAALTAVSPVLVAYSLNARAYSLLVLLACLSLWAMARALEDSSAPRLGLWALLAAACLWTHYYAVFLVAAELAALVWRLPGARLRVLGAASAVAAAFAPLVPLLSDQRDDRASHIDRLDLGERVEQAVRQLAAAPNPPSRVLEGLAVLLAAGGIAAGAHLARRERGVALLGGLGAAAVLVPLALAVLRIDDHFFMRNLLVAWACLAAVAGLGLLRARALPLALALLVGVALSVWAHADWRHQNADWEGAVAELGPRVDGVPVVVLPGIDHIAANTYLDRQVVFHPLMARSAWVIVEPGRRDRPDLEALPDFPRKAPPGFRLVETRTHRGFRMLFYDAGQPTVLNPADLGQDQVGQQPVALAPAPPGGPPPDPPAP